jgi:hypothetical protein
MLNLKKNELTTIILTLLLAITITLTVSPTINASNPPQDQVTFAKIATSANPIGVGQTTNIYMFLGNVPYASAALTNDYRYHNYILTITAPDGTVKTEKWDTITDPTNSQYYRFTPDQTGDYTLNFTFSGMIVNDYSNAPNSPFINDTYLPSSASMILTVQQEPIPSPINSYPLPEEYWTRPIYGENTDWWSISSNWLGTGIEGYGAMPGPDNKVFSGDSIGPITSHIMWTKPLQSGGVVGGNNFVIQGNTWFEGSAYVQRFTNPIIVHGRLYYTEPLSFENAGSLAGATYGPTTCVDLRTGQVVWSRTDVPPLSFAYIYDVEDPQQHGVYPAILATSNFGNAYDADTGEPLFNVTSLPSGTTVLGPLGEHIRYTLFNNGTSQSPDYYLCEWNSSLLWTGAGFTGSTTQWVPTISGTVQAREGIRYNWVNPTTQNQSITWRNSMSTNPSIVRVFYNDVMLLRNGSLTGDHTYFSVDINKTHTTYGQVQWWGPTIAPPDGITIVSFAGADPVNRVFFESYRQTSNFVGYSMKNGQKLWGPTPSQGAFDYYGSQGPGTLANAVAYGKIYSSAYSGILYCYDTLTGNLLWTYGNGGEGNSTNSGLQSYYGNYPTFVNAIGNGVVYLVTSEHTVETPIYKGALTRAVNATDGTEIYTLSAYTGEFATSSFAIADGFATFFNGYDNQIYSIGRGPSATAVTVSPKVSRFGDNVIIEGSVTDISAGTQQNEQAARFPNGVPVASDANMMEWMGYIYQQKPRPTNYVGVPVSIDVIDSNGNYRNVGTATTDSNGAYSFVWQPDIPGTFTLIATFAGNNGYWPSHSETAFNIMETQPTPAPTAAPQASMADLYFIPAMAGLFVFVAIIGAAIILILKKRP